MLPTFSPSRHAHSGPIRHMLAAVTISLGLVPVAGAAAILWSARHRGRCGCSLPTPDHPRKQVPPG